MTGRAEAIVLRDVHSPPMRAFHLGWVSFFACFFAWFSIAPLMVVVRDELGLTQQQVGDTIIASVAGTILARLAVGKLCDRYGPRRVYAALMGLGALPVAGLGLVNSYESLLILRLLVGGVGASFVVTQYHTTLMFSPTVVGTANATTAGWGNLGGGVTQVVMPLVMAGVLALGVEPGSAWRLSMLFPATLLLVLSVVYWRFTRDSPDGSWTPRGVDQGGGLLALLRDHRVVFLFLVYGACFGVELTIHNVAALYFVDNFEISIGAAGLAAACFGGMNLFARSLGGIASDRVGRTRGVRGRLLVLCVLLLTQGAALLAFAEMRSLWPAIASLIVFSVFVQMAEGATFAVVPFVNRDALGGVVGLVAAGGNTGAVAAGFLFRNNDLPWSDALSILGLAAILAALPVLGMYARYKEQPA
jgi:NNP family nitrate/nitrite transporter-like MFS transporter